MDRPEAATLAQIKSARLELDQAQVGACQPLKNAGHALEPLEVATCVEGVLKKWRGGHGT